MNETAMSEATMLASLRDTRLPAEAAGGVLAEYAAVVGMAALAAVCVVFVLRLLSIRRVATRTGFAVDTQPDMSGWSDDRRRVALLHQLRKRDPKRYSELAGDLYRPGGGPDLASLKDEVARRV
ncbi:hypothetical protein [Ruegeria arenilitoris]|uniref:hypothetical protein n=1 Tax=Ruegeria arenilitoris TaxID=1173585 RepID=UPI00147E6E85|nr:hypothetical protein [Ruegeria arenilitoris]